MAHRSLVHHIENYKSLQDLITINQFVVVDFSAGWCKPCKDIGPIYEELSKQYTNWTFCKVDVDLVPDAAESFCVNLLPTFVFIKDGKVVNTFEGANSEKLNLYLHSNY